jgi:putative Mg2+ transporter-C (MgtC) family protein
MSWIDWVGTPAPQLRTLAYVVFAMLLGAVIGVERELADKPAGLRTHMLVSGAAALLVSLGDVIVGRFDLDMAHGTMRSDPLRILEAVITGVSFLGAGTIIRRRRSEGVQGLTTAASLLFVAGVGVTVALTQLILAIGITIIVLIILRIFRYAEYKIGLGQPSPGHNPQEESV